MDQFDLRKVFRIPTTEQRLAGLNLRADLAAAAVRMVSDERSDREIQQLEFSLRDSESVVRLVEGRYGRRLGLLALTTQRVLFRPHGSTAGQPVTIALEDISAVEDALKRMTGRVVLRSTDSILEVDKILGNQAATFAEALRHQLTHPDVVPEHDPVKELIDLREQRAAGTISAADYDAAKRRLLEEL